MKRTFGPPPSNDDDADQQLVLQLVARAYPPQHAHNDDRLINGAIARLHESKPPASSARSELRLSFAMILLGVFAGGALAAVSIPTLLKRPKAPSAPLPQLPAPTSPVTHAMPAPTAPATQNPSPNFAPPAKPRPVAPTTVPASTPDAATENGAARLFEEARRARGLGWDALAATRFEQLITDFPTSPEADVSRLAAGRLYRRLGDHTSALSAFSSYVEHNPGGPLEEEAMAGVAQSLESLGRDATGAWQTLAAAHPQSPYLKGHAAKP